jgi:catechol 2,3-dioxygenase-like lactoylglutathione lyase family enzyme
MKTHVNFATSDLGASVDFYSSLLDATPVKHFDDYALFITEEPALELALDARDAVRVTPDAHYGIAVPDTAGVEKAIARLESAGLVRSIEREEMCCYANQTKVWATDPDGRRWEVYAVHEDTQASSDRAHCCA